MTTIPEGAVPEAAASDAEASGRRSWLRLKVWALVGLALALLIGANAHLVYVAFASRPACVAHAKAPVETQNAEAPVYRAARSAC